jgi:hypothetical protein
VSPQNVLVNPTVSPLIQRKKVHDFIAQKIKLYLCLVKFDVFSKLTGNLAENVNCIVKIVLLA